jgi:hypothetical protein
MNQIAEILEDRFDVHLETQSEIFSAQAIALIQSRSFKAVRQESELMVINIAKDRDDVGMLQQIIKHAVGYQVGCIHRSVVALRHSGASEEALTEEHLDACEVMIRAIIAVMRAEFGSTSESRKRAYEEMTNYAVVHYKESRVIADLVQERKVSSLRELIVILNGIRAIEAGALGEGFI